MYGNSERRSPLYKMIMLLLGLLLPASVMAVTTAPAGATGGTDQVCQGLDSGKIDTEGNPKTVTLTAPEGKLIDKYCVKAGSENSGDGPHYEVVDPPAKTVTISYPSGKDISHYSASYTDAPSCTTHPNTPGCVTPPDVCPEMPGTQPPGTVCTTPPPPVTDVCPNMPGTQPPGTTCTTPLPPVVMPPDTSSTELTKIWGNVRKVDKCGRAGDSFYAKRVKHGKYLVKGKAVREGVWLKAKTRVVKVRFVSTTKKHVAAGKDSWTLRFTNKSCATPPKHLPPTGA